MHGRKPPISLAGLNQAFPLPTDGILLDGNPNQQSGWENKCLALEKKLGPAIFHFKIISVQKRPYNCLLPDSPL